MTAAERAVLAASQARDLCLSLRRAFRGPPALARLHAGAATDLDQDDLVLALGTRLTDITTQGWTWPAEGQRLVHVCADPRFLGWQFPAAMALPHARHLARPVGARSKT